jgi:C4-dicarboxylate-specific signal transduction histidine kinase
MKELALYILDLAQNSITAGAKNIKITVAEQSAKDRMTISIEDDGCGMAPEFLKSAVDPFTTTRTTRKVGMGCPLSKWRPKWRAETFISRAKKEKERF